ncbi:Alpha/Beta hydrolase protein [Aspergillus floccosus]
MTGLAVSCRYMALNGHVTVISVEYRLSPEHVYPIPIDDGWNAVQHIISNLSSIVPNNTGPTKLVLCGTSSGGHLAAILSQRLPKWLSAADNASLAAQVSFDGVLLRAPVTVRGTDPEFIPPKFRQLHRSWMDDYHEAEMDRLSMTRNHDSLGVPVAERNSPDAYPLWGTLDGLPRTYIQICEMDILRDDATCYARALLDAGVEVRETLYKGLPHIFWIYGHHLNVSKMAQDDCVNGLRWLLRTAE